MPELAIGIDPGASTCMALVARTSRGPRLVRAWEIYSAASTDTARWSSWVHRTQRCLGEALAACDASVPVRIETTTAQARGGRRTQGLGQLHERTGALRAMAILAGFRDVDLIEQSAWSAAWRGQIRRSKDAVDPTHRELEAARLVRGARLRLEACSSAARRIDLAESVLIAGAVVLGAA